MNDALYLVASFVGAFRHGIKRPREAPYRNSEGHSFSRAVTTRAKRDTSAPVHPQQVVEFFSSATGVPNDL